MAGMLVCGSAIAAFAALLLYCAEIYHAGRRMARYCRNGAAASQAVPYLGHEVTVVEVRSLRHLKRRLRVIAGLFAFSVLANCYEAFVNYGSWTERAKSMQAAEQREALAIGRS